MNQTIVISALLATALASAPVPVHACGEGQFNMGQGMRYQGYLAPRPATVLVYADPGTAGDARQTRQLYQGLEQAGHRVTVVTDDAALAKAMATKRYDVVIASFAQVDAVESTVGAASSKPLVLPVVSRSARNAPALRDRFALFLLDGASLGQYLKVINQAVARKP